MKASKLVGGMFVKNKKNFNIIDICLLVLYIAATISLCYLIYFIIVHGIVNSDITIDFFGCFLVIISLFTIVLGITSLFGRGLVPYLFYKNPEAHQPYSLRHHLRYSDIVCLFFSIAFLLICADHLLDSFRFGRLGTILFYIGNVVVIIEAVRSRVKSKTW